MSPAEAWEKGYIAGYQIKHRGMTPTIPTYPATYPATLSKSDLPKYYYELGYKKGQSVG